MSGTHGVSPATPTALTILGVPLDFGASRRGVATGPEALRLAGLTETIAQMGYTISDLGNLTVPDRVTLTTVQAADHYVDIIASVCSDLAEHAFDIISGGGIPITMGGDHSIALGSVAGAARATNGPLGLLWLDAHADINTPDTSVTGNVHGQPVAHLLGMGDPRLSGISTSPICPENIVYIGLRDVDDPEKQYLKTLGITAYTMADVDRRGMSAVMDAALAQLTQRTGRVHVSLDADFLDPISAPGVGTPVPGGVSYREAHLALEMIHTSLVAPGLLTGLDLVEVNPFLDHENTTARVIVELAASCFGRRTL